MTKYVLTYTGGSGMAQSEAEIAKMMEAWGAWMGSMGEALLDGGNPFGASSTIAPDGSASDGGSSSLTGYTVISADDMAGAQKLAGGCPVLAGGGSIDIYEALDM